MKKMQDIPRLDLLHPCAIEGTGGVVPLIRRLCGELRKQSISYCHWKSNARLDRSASGINDLDLLVSRHDAQRFATILYNLGFKLFHPPLGQQVPGILDYYGYDTETDKLVHVHAHYRLILGHDATKNFHLPVEDAYLQSSTQGELFRVPDPAFEFLLFVLRMVLKHSTWDVIVTRQGVLSAEERNELLHLQPLAPRERVQEFLKPHMPYLAPELFDECIESLRPHCSFYARIRTGHRLLRALRSFARRSRFVDLGKKAWHRLVLGIRHRLFAWEPKLCSSRGGLLVAIVGGDGSGKTTAVDALQSWLADNFKVLKLHMGKPRWSATTVIVRVILKFGTMLRLYPFERATDFYTSDCSAIVFPGYPWMIRELCTARDRLLTFTRARRFAAGGGLVITDRFSLPQIRLMDGLQIERMTTNCHRNGLIRLAIRLETACYDRISPPDLLIVLKTNPEITVRRKTDEDASSVRARTAEIWNIEWQDTDAHVVDAGRSKSDVLSVLKELLWSDL